MRKEANDGAQQASGIRWAMSFVPRKTLATVQILSLSATPAKGKGSGCVLTSSLGAWLLLPGCEPPGVQSSASQGPGKRPHSIESQVEMPGVGKSWPGCLQ